MGKYLYVNMVTWFKIRLLGDFNEEFKQFGIAWILYRNTLLFAHETCISFSFRHEICLRWFFFYFRVWRCYHDNFGYKFNATL